MSDDYLWDRSGPEDPEVKQLEDLLAPLRHDAPLASRDQRPASSAAEGQRGEIDELRLRKRGGKRRMWIVGAVVAAAAAAALAIVIVRPRGDDAACTSGFAYERDGSAGVLCVGNTLDTGESRVDLAIANIGRAQLSADTRVTLDRTGADAHHLTLARGEMHAKVNAPPRLFQVGTPSTEVVDLGCEYTIRIAADGSGSIDVQFGQVELATKSGAIVVAPAGTHARILAGRVPGLPVATTASAELVDAVARYDRGDASALPTVLLAATPLDAITIANLAIVDVAHRRAILERLAVLWPPPDGTSVDAAMTPAGLQPWLDDIRLDLRFRAEEHDLKPGWWSPKKSR
jgi:hypothetical protein